MNQNWDRFSNDREAIAYLATLPRYENSFFKSAWWRFRFFISLVYCRVFRLTKPLFVVLVTNNGCNLKCTYCYGDYGHRSAKGDYSTVKLLEIIDELKSLGTRLLTIHGGEALLRRDIGEILNYAKTLGFYISLNTNGYYVDRWLDAIRCLDTAVISLDGSKENNDKYRGKGAYEKAITATKTLKENNVPVTISATLAKQTSGDMQYLGDLAQELGVNVQYSMLYNAEELSGTGKSDYTLLQDEDIRAVTREILNLKKRRYPVYYNNKALEALLKWPTNLDQKSTVHIGDKLTRRQKKDMINCYHGSLKFQIDADGRVITCWHHDKEDAPNIKELGVTNALKRCNEENDCIHCSFLANNEHNALMDLSPSNILSVGLIQFRDLFMMKLRGPRRWVVNHKCKAGRTRHVDSRESGL